MEPLKLITSALEYLDTYSLKYKKILDKVHYIKYIDAKDESDYYRIKAYDANKKLLFESRYEILGVYESQAKIWIWGWAHPLFTHNTTQVARQLVNYGMNMAPDRNIFLKTELITSRYIISNNKQLDIHSAIGLYLSKHKCLYKCSIDADDLLNWFDNELTEENIRKLQENDFYVNVKPKYKSNNKKYYLILLDM